MKMYIRCKQHKNSTPKHKTTTEVSHWNDQQYKFMGGGGGGGGSLKKVQMGNDQEKVQSERDSHSKNQINNQALIP